jgi:hypothetical protein
MMAYTRFMAQTCDAFERSAVLSDTLIRPLVKASELLSRANDHFSYSDIKNAEVRGAILISMSTNSFLAELQHIKDFISFFPVLKDNSESFERGTNCSTYAEISCSYIDTDAIPGGNRH